MEYFLNSRCAMRGRSQVPTVEIAESAYARRVLPVLSAADLPFPPGKSPFRMKGNAYRNAKDFHERVVPGGVAAVAAALGDNAMRDFYLQPFLVGGWYDALPVLLCTRTAAKLRGQSGPEFLSESGRNMAEKDLGGLHKIL